MPAMSAVLPVPGPPVITASGRRRAASIAATCSVVQRPSICAAAPGFSAALRRAARADREALLEAQIALVVEAAVVDDERPVVARAPDERRERGQRQAGLGELRGGGAIVLRDAQAGEPVADRREIAAGSRPPRGNRAMRARSARRRARAPRSSAGQPPASMAR